MAILTLDEAKTLLSITSTDQVAQIALLLPIVEDDLLSYLNNDFLDSTGTAQYPPSLKMYVAQMLMYKMRTQSGGVKSEKVSRYEVVYDTDPANMTVGYPKSIMSGLTAWRKVRW